MQINTPVFLKSLDILQKMRIIRFRIILNQSGGFMTKNAELILNIINASYDHLTAEQIAEDIKALIK